MPPLTIRTKDGQVKTVNWEGPNAPTQRDVEEIEAALYQQGVFKMRQAPVMAATAPSVGRPSPMQGTIAPNSGTLAPSNLGAQFAQQIGLPQGQPAPIQGPPAPRPIRNIENDSEYKKQKAKKAGILAYLNQKWVQRTLSEYGETPDIKAKRQALEAVDQKLNRMREAWNQREQIANQGRELGLEQAAAKQIIQERKAAGQSDPIIDLKYKASRGIQQTATGLGTSLVGNVMGAMTGTGGNVLEPSTKANLSEAQKNLGEVNQAARNVARVVSPVAKVPVVGGVVSDMTVGTLNPLESVELVAAFGNDPEGTLNAVKDSYDWTKAKTPEQQAQMAATYIMTAAGLVMGGKGIVSKNGTKLKAKFSADLDAAEKVLANAKPTPETKKALVTLKQLRDGIDVALDPQAVKVAKRNEKLDGKTPPPSPMGMPSERAPAIVKADPNYQAGDAPNLVRAAQDAKRKQVLTPKEEPNYEGGEVPSLVKMAGKISDDATQSGTTRNSAAAANLGQARPQGTPGSTGDTRSGGGISGGGKPGAERSGLVRPSEASAQRLDAAYRLARTEGGEAEYNNTLNLKDSLPSPIKARVNTLLDSPKKFSDKEAVDELVQLARTQGYALTYHLEDVLASWVDAPLATKRAKAALRAVLKEADAAFDSNQRRANEYGPPPNLVEQAKKNQTPSQVEGVSVKEPWQMTKTEAMAAAKARQDNLAKGMGKKLSRVARWEQNPTIRGIASDAHKEAVKTALRDGKPVPPEVLADYPDLAKQPRKSDVEAPQTSKTPQTGKDVEVVASPDVTVAVYNGKVVRMDYIANTKDRFKRAAQRIADNGAEGYVIEPNGKVYRISKDSRSAKVVTGAEKEQALKEFAQTVASDVDKTTQNVNKSGDVTQPTKLETEAKPKTAVTPKPIPDAPREAPKFDIPTTSEKKATGLANQVQARELKKYAPPDKGVTNKDGEAHLEGRKLVQDGTINPEKLAQEIADEQRPFTWKESGALLEGKRRLLNEVNAAKNAVDLATSKDRAIKVAEYEAAQARLDTFVDNVQKGKTEWSNTGRALQEGTTLDEGNFANVLSEYKTLTGKKPDPKTEARLKELSDEIKDRDAKIEALESELIEAKAGRGTEKDSRKGKKLTREAIKKEREEIFKELDEILKGATSRVSDVGAVAYDAIRATRVAGKLAINYMKEAGITLEEVIVRVIADFRAKGIELDREDVLTDVQELTTRGARTKTDLEKQVEALKREAKTYAKAIQENKAIPTAQGRQYLRFIEEGASRMTKDAKAAARLTKQIEELQRVLDEGGEVPTRRKAELTGRVKQLTEQRDALLRAARDISGNRSVMTRQGRVFKQYIENNAARKTKEAVALEKTAAKIAEITRRLDEGDYTVPTEKEKIVSTRLQNERARRDLLSTELKARMQADRPQTVGQRIVGVVNLPKTLLSSIDISAPGRQGFFLSLANPKVIPAAFRDQIKAMFSREGALKIQRDIITRENAGLYKRGGLYLSPMDGLGVVPGEEAFMSSALQRWRKFNPYAASERAYGTYLNRIRADVMDNFIKALGPNASTEELKIAANYINVATGRGGSSVGLDKAASALNNVFFSPRYVASRFEYTLGQPLFKSSTMPLKDSLKVRKLVAREYAKAIAAVGAIYGLAKLSQGAGGPEIETDAASTDFLKLRWGNTRVDPLAGVQQGLVLGYRAASGRYKTSKGNEIDMRTGEYGKPTTLSVIAQFGRGKMSPMAGNALSISEGKNIVGEPFGWREFAVNSATPITVRELIEGAKEDGWDEADYIGLLNFLGISVNTYGKDKEAKPDPR